MSTVNKDKESKSERREAIQNIINTNNFEDFTDKITSAISYFGKDLNKSSTVCVLNKLLHFKNKINELNNAEEVFNAIKNLMSGKMINGEKPSLTATITSEDCEKIGKKLKEFWFDYYCENVEIIYAGNPFFEDLEIGMFEFEKATTINHYAFAQLNKLKKLSFPKVKEVRSNAFYYCQNLKTIKLPEVNHVGREAFHGCKNLEKVNLSKAMYVDKRAFVGCEKLRKNPDNIVLSKNTKINKNDFEFV
ncbi:MAG: leucine-rich repeat domain-containing protein [Clostridia bacterium]|nr:leucine-rich repeat domain-containing protein [Clostridia bacterium]